MFTKASLDGYQEKTKGVQLKALSHGERTLITNVKISKGASIPIHQHIHEQTGILISGILEFVVNEEIFLTHPGDSWTILCNTPHGATAIEDCEVVEVFSPVRDDYLS